MNVINFGSLNLDHFYEVDHFVRPGETITSEKYHLFCGGKGLNQSVALANAGAQVFHAGKIGRDGQLLLDRLTAAGVDTSHVQVAEGEPSGHAIIQVDKNGQNSIIIHGGANQAIRKEDVERALCHFESGDYVLLQNETSLISEMIDQAKRRGLTLFFNPSPMDHRVLEYALDKVDFFIINEIEGKELTGESDPEAITKAMLSRFPSSATILTLGENGAVYADRSTRISIPAEKVKPVDTTAAGDTFIGYFIAQKMKGSTAEDCLRIASRAAAICVTRHGAADSIPRRDEVTHEF